jgi:uncharacterized cofD-like protein
VPVTEDNAHLVAEFTTGVVLTNEHDIDVGDHVTREARIKELRLSTPARVSVRAQEVLLGADLIVLGPGDVYTSILANCIVGGMREVFMSTEAKIVYVLNLMSRKGQALNMGSSEYLDEIKKYTGRFPDYMFVHTGSLREDLLSLYAKEGEYPVVHTPCDDAVRVVQGDFVSQDDVTLAKGDTVRRSLIRHDSEKLARAIIDLL